MESCSGAKLLESLVLHEPLFQLVFTLGGCVFLGTLTGLWEWKPLQSITPVARHQQARDKNAVPLSRTRKGKHRPSSTLRNEFEHEQRVHLLRWPKTQPMTSEVCMIFLFFVMPFLSISTEQIQQLHKLHQEAQALLEIDTWILRKAQEMQQKYSKIEGLNQQIQKLETLCKISPQIALAPPAQFLGQTLQLQQEQIQQSLKRDLFETQQRLDLEILARGIRPPSNPQRCWIPMALKWISPKASIMVQALSERAGFQIHQSNRQFYWHFYNPTVRAL